MKLPIVLVPHPHVRVDGNVLGGSPYVLGSRVPVRRLWAFFKNGTSVERILRRYPQLGAAKVFDALAFALDNPEVMTADMQREDEILKKAGMGPANKPVNTEQMELPFAAESAAPARPAARSKSKR
ncbi:MAG: DUF433 domain-containing protein [Myxococcota bacterium]|jgi:uncharacterized protein (DUF433 family)|nr:DUF433 domain-containing protein [Myxococcota bacterium]